MRLSSRQFVGTACLVLALNGSALAQSPSSPSSGDWKINNFLYFKVEHELANRTLVAKTTLHGPVAGIGLYF